MTGSFDKSFKFTRITLLLSGISINPSRNPVWIVFLNYLFYFNFLWLYTDVFGEFFWIIDGIQVGKSFSELSLIAPCTTLCLLATSKITPMFYYRHIAINVFEKLKKMHPKFDDNDTSKNAKDFKYIKKVTAEADESEMIERKIVEESTWFLNFVNHLLYYSSVVVIVAFTTLPLMTMAYDYYKNGEFELSLPFLTKYFFNPFTRTMWPIVYLHQVWSTFIACFNLFGMDTFLYAFCTYSHMHFRILCHRFEHVVSESLTETRQRLTVLMKRHQELIDLVNQVEILSSTSMLFNMITSSVLICLSAFNVTVMDDGATLIAFGTFLILSLSQISLLCLFGDLLMRSFRFLFFLLFYVPHVFVGAVYGIFFVDYIVYTLAHMYNDQSTKVSEGVYNCRWYDADPGIKRSILFILIRAQRPCRLTAANFSDLNLTAFTTILSRSWSYFALLRTVYK